MSIPQQNVPIYQPPMVDFNWIADGWRGFSQRPWPWVGATFLAGAFMFGIYILAMVPAMGYIGYHASKQMGNSSNIPVGLILGMYAVMFLIVFGMIIVSFVFAGGLFRMAYQQLQGEEVGVLTFLSIGDSLGALIWLGLLHTAISIVGSIGCGIPTIIGHGLFMFAPLIAVTQRVSAIDACRQSFDMLRGQWFMATVFAFVLWILASLGGAMLGIGALVTVPVAVLAVTAGFYRLGGVARASAMAGFGGAQEGVWPPPPEAVGGSMTGVQPSPGGWSYPPPPGGSGHLPPNPYGYGGNMASQQSAVGPGSAASPVESVWPADPEVPSVSLRKENKDADGSSHELV